MPVVDFVYPSNLLNGSILLACLTRSPGSTPIPSGRVKFFHVAPIVDPAAAPARAWPPFREVLREVPSWNLGALRISWTNLTESWAMRKMPIWMMEARKLLPGVAAA